MPKFNGMLRDDAKVQHDVVTALRDDAKTCVEPLPSCLLPRCIVFTAHIHPEINTELAHCWLIQCMAQFIYLPIVFVAPISISFTSYRCTASSAPRQTALGSIYRRLIPLECPRECLALPSLMRMRSQGLVEEPETQGVPCLCSTSQFLCIYPRTEPDLVLEPSNFTSWPSQSRLSHYVSIFCLLHRRWREPMAPFSIMANSS